MRRLDAIRARLAAATPGPWFAARCSYSTERDCCQIDTTPGYHGEQGGIMHCYAYDECKHPMSRLNGELVAAAPTDLDAMERQLREIGTAVCELSALRGVTCANQSAHEADWCWPCRIRMRWDLP